MKIKLVIMASIFLISIIKIEAQDLNSINGSGFNIATGFTPLNAPQNTVILGLQSQYDVNYKWQFVNAYNTDNYYLRRYVDGIGWGNYYKIWHSGNLTPEKFLSKNTASIGNAGSVNDFINGYTFAYATSGSPWNGALISFGGFSNNYDCQISTDYGPHGGKHMSFRTKNGDSGGWNTWNEIWHSGNLNKDDIDFNCKNLYANGNLWAKEIKVALTNPWADFVFKPEYNLMTINELEKFIKQKGHLPEIPSADEIQTNGINIGEIQTKLLQKIEEQTLYIIELNKQIQELKRQMAELKK